MFSKSCLTLQNVELVPPHILKIVPSIYYPHVHGKMHWTRSVGVGWSRSRLSNSKVHTHQTENRSVLGTKRGKAGLWLAPQACPSKNRPVTTQLLQAVNRRKLPAQCYPILWFKKKKKKKQILEIQFMWNFPLKKIMWARQSSWDSGVP